MRVHILIGCLVYGYVIVHIILRATKFAVCAEKSGGINE
jgi:hypothetical protein